MSERPSLCEVGKRVSLRDIPAGVCVLVGQGALVIEDLITSYQVPVQNQTWKNKIQKTYFGVNLGSEGLIVDEEVLRRPKLKSGEVILKRSTNGQWSVLSYWIETEIPLDNVTFLDEQNSQT